MADDMNDLMKKRLAARAASKLVVDLPAPSLNGRFGLSAIDPDAYVRDHGDRTMPAHMPLELSAQEVADDVTEGYRNRDYAQDDRDIAIREQMERLNEAPEGGLAVFQQMKEGGGFLSRDGSIYYIEPEGKFMMVRDPHGNLEAFAVSAVGNMLERQAAQHRLQGGELPKTPEPKKVVLRGPTQADTNNLIAKFKDRIRAVAQGRENEKVYAVIEQIVKESTTAYAAASIPEKQPPAIGLDPDKGKVDMVVAIAAYGREEGKNIVRELREHGGEIEQHSLSYRVEGETFSRTHPDKTTFDYKADEIEQAVDVRQKELGAIDVWESKSPALDLQDRIAAEIGQERELAVDLATTEETLAALALLDDAVEQEREMTAKEIAADDKRILDERFERDLPPDDGLDHELTSAERREAEARDRHIEEASQAQDDARELGENIAAYGEDRGTDLISELREKGGEIEHDGATYTLETKEWSETLSRTKDGETTKHNAYDVKDGIDHQREDEQQSREAAMSPYERMEAGLSRPDDMTEQQWDGLRKQYEHDLLMENTPEEFITGERVEDMEPLQGYTPEQEAMLERDQAEMLGREEYGHGVWRNTDLVTELREQGEFTSDGFDWATGESNPIHYKLEGNEIVRTQGGETTRHNADDVQEGIMKERSDRDTEHQQAIVIGIAKELGAEWGEGTKLDRLLETGRESFGQPAQHGWSVDRQTAEIVKYQNEGELLRANVTEVQGRVLLDQQIATYKGRDAADQRQAAAPAEQPSELDALKAQMAELQEKLAAYEKPQEQAQSAEQQQAPAKEMQLGAEQGKREVTDKEVIDQVEGRTKGKEWSNVLSDRYAQREATGEKVEDKPFVARARESEAVAASKSREQQHTQSPSQSLQ